MKKTTMQTEAFKDLICLCQLLQIPFEAEPEESVTKSLQRIQRIGSMLTGDLQMLIERTSVILSTLARKDFVTAIDSLSLMADQVIDSLRGIHTLYNQFTEVLIALRQCTQPEGWSPVLSNEQMQAAINEGCTQTDIFSLGFRNGQYALLFEEEEDSNVLVTAPVLIAVGRSEDTDAIHAYIQQSLDMAEGDEDA